jgi:peptide/nickel transport system substrate-binding protein
VAALTVSLGLLAAACSSDKKSVSTTATTVAGSTAPTTAATGSTTADGTTAPTTPTSGTTPATTGATTVDTAAPTTVAREKAVPGGSITISGEAEVANPWTPAAMQCDPYCYTRARTFFDQLVIDGGDATWHPYLAESVTPNADSSVWTVKVRSGVTFTDGTPVNADAVIRNLNDTGTGLLVGKALKDIARVPDPSGAKNADGTPVMQLKLAKIDDLTLTISTGLNGDPTKPISWPGLPWQMAGQWGLIASPVWLDAVKADPTKASMPVGSGPFIVQSFTPGDQMVVTKNPKYWQKDAAGVQLPYLDKVTFKVIQDAQTAQQALEAGNIDMFSTSAAQVIKSVRDEKTKFPMLEQSSYGDTYYLLIDLAKAGALADARVRCALSMAIDRQELINLVGGGISPLANGLFSPGQEGYLADNGFDASKQNIDAAKALIDDYKKSTGASSVEVELGSTVDRYTQQAADLLKGYWSQIGVDTKQDVVPQDQYITNALFGVPTFAMYQWRSHSGVIVDVQNLWWNSASGTADGPLSLNFARLNDPTIDADLSTARSDPDPAKRKAAAEDINKTMAKNCYSIPLSWTIWATAHKPNVMGVGEGVLPDGGPATEAGKANSSGQIPLLYVWVKQ